MADKKYFAWVAALPKTKEIRSGVYTDLKTFKGAERRVKRLNPGWNYIALSATALPNYPKSEPLNATNCEATREYMVEDIKGTREYEDYTTVYTLDC